MLHFNEFLFEHYALHLFGVVFCGIDYLEALVGNVAQMLPIWLVFLAGRRNERLTADSGLFCAKRYGIS